MEGALMYLDENGDPIENPEYLNDYGELPGDPRARIHPEVVPESAPTSWGEAMFPRASAARASGDPWYSPRVGLGSILDQASLPGRAFASIARPGGESYQAALGRLSAPELIPQSGDRLGNETTDKLSEAVLRDPANIPLAAISAATGGAALPAWLAKLGWAGRGAAQGVPMGAAMAATRQGENIAAGRPVSGGEAGLDAAMGLGFGAAAELPAVLGRGMMTGAKRGLQQIFKPGTAKKGQEINDLRRALDAGLLPEMAGYANATAQGAGKRFGERLAEKEMAYPRVLAAADATGQRVSVGGAMNRARGDVAEQMATGRLPASVDEATEALGWVADRAAIPDDPAMVRAMLSGEAPSSALTLTPSVAQARKSALWKEAFKDPTKSTARGAATKATARGMAEELGKISPELAALNAEMAPWYAAAPAMIRAAGSRGNAYGFGPMEALGFIGGTGVGGYQEGLGGGLGGGIGAALAVRALRSPAAMRALYDAGRVGIGVSPAIRRTVPLAISATDNAR